VKLSECCAALEKKTQDLEDRVDDLMRRGNFLLERARNAEREVRELKDKELDSRLQETLPASEDDLTLVQYLLALDSLKEAVGFTDLKNDNVQELYMRAHELSKSFGPRLAELRRSLVLQGVPPVAVQVDIEIPLPPDIQFVDRTPPPTIGDPPGQLTAEDIPF